MKEATLVVFTVFLSSQKIVKLLAGKATNQQAKAIFCVDNIVGYLSFERAFFGVFWSKTFRESNFFHKAIISLELLVKEPMRGINWVWLLFEFMVSDGRDAD